MSTPRPPTRFTFLKYICYNIYYMNLENLKLISERVRSVLLNNQNLIKNVIDFDFNNNPFYIFDLTEKNEELLNLDLSDQDKFIDYIFNTMKKSGCEIGIGRYDEDRIIYRRSSLFAQNEEARSLHLGIDIWAQAGVEVFSPLPAVVHSFQDNAHFGDYGPTIILEHVLGGEKFYTLYGHLSRESLAGLSVGKNITAGEKIATIGDYDVNGNWPAHLHFEIIVDIQDKVGDFAGVGKPSERELWLATCPNPNLILKINKLPQ